MAGRALGDVSRSGVVGLLEAGALEPKWLEQALLHRLRVRRPRRRGAHFAGDHVAGVRVRPEAAAGVGEQFPRARSQIGGMREKPARSRAVRPQRLVEVEHERREGRREPLGDRGDPERRVDLDRSVGGELHLFADEEPGGDGRDAAARPCLAHDLGQSFLRNRARHAGFRYPTRRPRPGSRDVLGVAGGASGGEHRKERAHWP